MLSRLAAKRLVQVQQSAPMMQQVRMVQGHPRRTDFRDNRYNPPASEKTFFTNEFDQVDHPDDFKKKDAQANFTPETHDMLKLKETCGDPHAQCGYGEWKSMQYDWVREPVFPKRPDLAAGELASGATVTRTDVWRDPNEPAITSIAKFSPYNFRPTGYADNVLVVDSTYADEHLDCIHNRLPVGHADRRPFLYMLGAVTAFAGLSMVRGACLKMVHCLWPCKDVFAAGVIEVDLRPIRMGQNFSAKWRGKPVFIRRRTEEMINAARKDDVIVASMRDPATDFQRCAKPEWLVCIGVCTHLGCIPYPDQGDWGGYFCPCHGSHYDHAGRLRKGPAPLNLEIPPYKFLDDNTVKIG